MQRRSTKHRQPVALRHAPKATGVRHHSLKGTNGIFRLETGWVANVMVIDDSSDKDRIRLSFKVLHTLGNVDPLFVPPQNGGIFCLDSVRDMPIIPYQITGSASAAIAFVDHE